MPTSLTPPTDQGWNLDHSYARLPKHFYASVRPQPVAQPEVVVFNDSLAAALGLDPAVGNDAALWAGNELPPKSEPIAQAYAGHQFGRFTMLGDGRAILLGEQIDPQGRRFDIQLKGPGPTPYSRRGDGRAALGPMLREHIISEAMHALGIPTTRSLAVATTGEVVWRQDRLPGAVLTRVAASHIRVGTFEWAAAREEKATIQALADYTIQRHYPDLADQAGCYSSFLNAVVERQAALIAKWMHVGFIHGVMNTDNMAISGETIDYGPCAFMDAYDPATVFSSIDHQGRYAYGNQPHIAQWNLARFAEALLPLLSDDEASAVEIANEAINRFQPLFKEHWLNGMRAKLGLFNEEAEDLVLVQSVLEWMKQTKSDFTNTFRHLPDASKSSPWYELWTARRTRQPQTIAESDALMQSVNPAVIPRNHKVEEALEAASNGDLRPMNRLLEVIAIPFEDPQSPEFTTPAPVDGPRYQTLCGT